MYLYLYLSLLLGDIMLMTQPRPRWNGYYSVSIQDYKGAKEGLITQVTASH